MKIMGKYDIGLTTIYVGQQDFKNGYVPVMVGKKEISCPMKTDVDGDIYFEYDGNIIYFHYLKG